eukprot:2215320-Karenia_brevis.AAC.1
MYAGIPGKQAAEMLLCLRRISHLSRRYGDMPQVFFCKADLWKAFDRIYHSGVIAMLEASNMPKIWINCFARLLHMCCVCPSIAANQAKQLILNRGVRQGRIESMLHFVMTVAFKLESLLASWQQRGLGLYFDGHFVGLFNYADDFVILAPSAVQLRTMFGEISDCLHLIGLQFSFEKRKT